MLYLLPNMVMKGILQIAQNGNEVGAVFFDFRKAFNSVPYCTLLGKQNL